MNEFSLPDVLYVLASHIDNQATLAVLCLVSKQYNTIFTAPLYRDIYLERTDPNFLARIENLSNQQHIENTEYLRIRWTTHRNRSHAQVGHPDDAVAHSDLAHSEAMCRLFMLKMNRLQSIEFWGTLGPYATINMLTDQNSPLERLSQCQTLRQVSLTGWGNNHFNFGWPIPPFRNLTKLVLQGLQRDREELNVDDIVEVIIASPGLRTLGISLHAFYGSANDTLWDLVLSYSKQREELGLSLLCLEELTLGFGFMPTCPRDALENPEGGIYRLELFTDLSYLRRLQLDNWTSNMGDVPIPFFYIDEELLFAATNLQSLQVERFSKDIVKLVQKLEPLGELVELEVSRYFETLPRSEVVISDPALLGDPIFSTELTSVEIGRNWSKLSYGTKLEYDEHSTSNSILRSIARYAQLREFSAPMTEEDILVLKDVILPSMNELQVLMITGGFIEDHEFLQPSYNEHTRMDLEAYLNREHEEIEQEAEEQRIKLTKSLFQRSMGRKLKYIGLVEKVYCNRLHAPGEDLGELSFTMSTTELHGVATGDEFQIIRLSPHQAREFEMVRRLYPNKDFWF